MSTRADEIFKELGLYPKENAFHKTEEYKYVCREPDVVMVCYNALCHKFPELVPRFGGVAATLIKGETIHSAVHLMKTKVDVEHMKEWTGTRMIIIDEISFASSAIVLNLNEKLGRLKWLCHAPC